MISRTIRDFVRKTAADQPFRQSAAQKVVARQGDTLGGDFLFKRGMPHPGRGKGAQVRVDIKIDVKLRVRETKVRFLVGFGDQPVLRLALWRVFQDDLDHAFAARHFKLVDLAAHVPHQHSGVQTLQRHIAVDVTVRPFTQPADQGLKLVGNRCREILAMRARRRVAAPDKTAGLHLALPFFKSPGDIPGTPRCISLNRVEPDHISHRTSMVQRGSNRLAAIATGQNFG